MSKTTTPGKRIGRLFRWLRRSIKIILLVILSGGVIYGGAWLIYYWINAADYRALPVMEVPQSKRTLVIAPHNDDEVLTNSILIKRLIDQGADVQFAIITNGDGFTPDIMLSSKKLVLRSSDYIRLGMLRQMETLDGLSLLNVPPENIRFLGYPDRGCLEIFQYHWDAKVPYFDPWTQSTSVPYPNSYGDMPSLTGENILRDLYRVLEEVRPDLILMPHPADQNVDHAALNALMQFALSELDMDGVPQILFLTHHALNTWPRQGYPPNAGPYLLPPRDMRAMDDTDWQVLPTTAEDRQLASQIIGQYKSQLVVDNAYLHSFIRENQLFATRNRPALIQGRRADAQIEPLDENRLLLGLPATALGRITGRERVEGVYGEVSNEGTLHLMMRLSKPLQPHVMHRFHLMLGDGRGGVTQSKIIVRNGKIYENGGALNFALVQAEGSLIHISIPYSAFANVKTFLISASICENESIINQSVWQSVELPT